MIIVGIILKKLLTLMVFTGNKTFNIILCISCVCANYSESVELVKFETPGTHSPTV